MAFIGVHRISDQRVRRLCNLVREGVMSPKDNRGHHNSHPVTDDLFLEQMDAHIKIDPYRVAHYGKSATKKRYLSSNLSDHYDVDVIP